MTGHFIVIEGLEGAGKSSAVATIEACLTQAKQAYIKVREPGGTPLAEALRELIKQPWQESVSAEAELMVMYAARVQLVRNVIQPALVAGNWVIGDRHDMSSQAYQGGGREIDSEVLATLKRINLGDFAPDLTIYLDIDPVLGLQRAQGRGELDRIEQEDLQFFQRTRARYQALVASDPNAYLVDASQSMQQVQADVRRIVLDYLEQPLKQSLGQQFRQES